MPHCTCPHSPPLLRNEVLALRCAAASSWQRILALWNSVTEAANPPRRSNEDQGFVAEPGLVNKLADNDEFAEPGARMLHTGAALAARNSRESDGKETGAGREGWQGSAEAGCDAAR